MLLSSASGCWMSSSFSQSFLVTRDRMLSEKVFLAERVLAPSVRERFMVALATHLSPAMQDARS